MSRRTRSSVGTDVWRRAQRLSDDLLLEEQSCLAKIEGAFVDTLPQAETILRRAIRKGMAAAVSTDRYLDDLDGVLVQTMAAAGLAFEALIDVTQKMTVDSIGDELRLCESALAAKYGGIADAAILAVVPQVETLQTAALEAFEETYDPARAWFREQVLTEWRAAATADEDAEQITRRMFSTTPVTLPGHSGRGLWWKPYSWLARAAREKEIWMVNQIRTSAMAAFNAAGEQV